MTVTPAAGPAVSDISNRACIYCVRCGRSAGASQRFCRRCGYHLDARRQRAHRPRRSWRLLAIFGVALSAALLAALAMIARPRSAGTSSFSATPLMTRGVSPVQAQPAGKATRLVSTSELPKPEAVGEAAIIRPVTAVIPARPAPGTPPAPRIVRPPDPPILHSIMYIDAPLPGSSQPIAVRIRRTLPDWRGNGPEAEVIYLGSDPRMPSTGYVPISQLRDRATAARR